MEKEIRAFIVENYLFGVPDEGLKDGDSLLDRGIIDSTGVLEFVAFLEKSYGIEVEDEELIPENLDSIANVSAYVRRKRDGVSQRVLP